MSEAEVLLLLVVAGLVVYACMVHSHLNQLREDVVDLTDRINLLVRKAKQPDLHVDLR
jgi:hypothetical protein